MTPLHEKAAAWSRSAREVRSSGDRWAALQRLLAQIDTLAQCNLAIDTVNGAHTSKLTEALKFERDIEEVTLVLRREVKRLTAERLTAELRERMKKDRR